MKYINLNETPLCYLTVGEFLNLLKSNTPPPPAQAPKEKITIKGIHALAKFLQVSAVTAQTIKNSGKIPYSQFNRTIVFDGDEVLAAMKVNNLLKKTNTKR
jgi:hypothetical protein